VIDIVKHREQQNLKRKVLMRIQLRKISLVIAMFISLKSVSQQLIQGTLRLGPNSDEVQVWIKPNFNNSAQYLYQIGMPIAWASTASPQPNLTVSNVTISDQFKTVFGTNYSVTVNPAVPNTCGTQLYANIVLIRGGNGASNPQTWAAGTEYLVCTVKFTPSGAPGVPVSLVDYQDGGSDGQGNFYTVDGNANYYVSSTSVNNIYPASGQSTVVSTCGGSSAQTNVAIPVPCVAPTINVTNPTTNSANIGWNTISGATGYEYSISTSSSLPASGTSTTGTSFPATGLVPGIQYYVFVRTNCGAGGFSSWATTNFTTPDVPCSAPTGPTIGAVGIATADFSWGAVGSATGYEYVISTSNGTPVSSGTAISGTNYTASGLIGGTQYYIYVRTNCGSGNYSTWASATFTTQPPLCAPPSTPIVNSITTTTADINWNAVSGSAGYEYVISTGSGTPTGAGIVTSGTSISATGLTPGTAYYIFVRNNCGGGLYSSWAMSSFNTQCPDPASVSVPSSTITSSSAIITWNVTGAASYQYDISTSPVPTTETPSTGGTITAGTSYNATGLASGITYYAHIRSICAAGNFSTWVSVPFTTICTTPGPIAISGISPTSANIIWGAVPDVGGYEYFISTNQNSPASGTPTIFNNVSLSNLTQGTLYYVYVRTQCSPGVYSGWINNTFTTTFPPCNAPFSLNISINNDKASINWPAVSGAVGYEYVISTSSNTPTTGGTFTNSPSASINGLNPSTRYYVYVRTQCGPNRYSGWIFQSFMTTCYKPTINLIKNLPTLGSAELGWYSIKGAMKYEYAILNNAAPPSGSINFTTDTITRTSGLVAGNKYYFHVRTHCSFSGISDWSTKEFYASGLSILYLSKNVITIASYGTEIENGEIALFDASGKLIKTIKLTASAMNIDLGSLASGMYFIRYGKDKEFVKKIIKL
jgi:hypothetical protein